MPQVCSCERRMPGPRYARTTARPLAGPREQDFHPRAYGERTMAGMLKEIESAAQSLGIKFNPCRHLPLTISPTRSPQ